MAKQRRISGTREWSTHSANCVRGCSHNCRYCFARYDSVTRFKLVPSMAAWPLEQVVPEKLRVMWGKKKGTIMFPTQHDITPATLDSCLVYLQNILNPGNNVLIVSKPHLQCIEAICDMCEKHNFKSQVMFRFSIGALDDTLLQYWEPGAPQWLERFESLRHAHDRGYKTSISMEPLLDVTNVKRMFSAMAPYVTDSIWIGRMNKPRLRVPIDTAEDEKQVKRIEEGQTPTMMKWVYDQLKDEPLVRWKESYKELLGLDMPKAAGLDV